MPTAHKVLVRAGESSLGRTSAAAALIQLKSNTNNSSTKEISGSWRKDEHKLFLQGLEQHGRKWKKIAAVVGTRTKRQVQSHAQKYFAKLESAKTKETNEMGVEDEPMIFQFHVSWDERFQQLVEYKDQNGHCRVPIRFKANLQLGSWVSTQRQQYKKNKLSPEQKDRLEGIGFEWVLKKQEHSVGSWDERFKQLKEYREKKGHCLVPQKYKANPQLGEWVSRQRHFYKKNELLPEQKDRLEGIGFVWVLKKHEIVGWDERFKQLKEYRQVKGDCNVPYQYDANPQLGYWVNRQRQVIKKGKLSPEQIKSLEGIGFK